MPQPWDFLSRVEVQASGVVSLNAAWEGNKVIISGRHKSALEEVGRANPGIECVELDIENPQSITSVANLLAKQHPELNELINKRGHHESG